MTFPVGIYKAMRSVTEGIHHISLANNELKSLTSRFVTTFSQLRGKGQPCRIATATSKPPGQAKSPQAAAEGAQHPRVSPPQFLLLCAHNSFQALVQPPSKIHFPLPFPALAVREPWFCSHPPSQTHLLPPPATLGSAQAAAGSLSTLQLPPRMGLG